MKRISSQTTFLYQIVWPIFSSIILIVLIKLMFTIPVVTVFGFVYIVVYIWITPMFVKLKGVWLESDCLLVENISGKKITINKKDIAKITQNATMITPRIVKISLKSGSDIPQIIRFIPTGGYWKYWQHEIVEELNNWRLKD